MSEQLSVFSESGLDAKIDHQHNG